MAHDLPSPDEENQGRCQCNESQNNA